MDNKEVWNSIYESGHSQKAPWDVVVSFVYRNKPKEKSNTDINILEIGCGTASNLFFLAQQGFKVSGLDISSKAITVAKERFDAAGLSANLVTDSFETLDFPDSEFDLVIDRAALTCVGKAVQAEVIKEIYRILKPRGRFLYTPYAATHSSCIKENQDEDGIIADITTGTLQGVGSICFLNEEEVKSLLKAKPWNILSFEYETRQDMMKDKKNNFHSCWRVVAEKK
jgi:ubiquinone/menaquinone biosynthesis C-methylase UbiE